MPLPKPRDDESQDEFIARCMSDELMQEEYDDNDQRLAICFSQWRNREGKSMNIERKIIEFEIKAVDEEKGVFEGYAATFSDKPDSYGDVIDPGAFKKTIRDSGKRVKILWNHNILEPIGKPQEVAEDEKGLFIKGKLSLGVQRAREVLSLMKDGVITEMSIGYDTIRAPFVDGIRHLKELKLWDVSPVTFAANPEAVIVGVKTATTFDDLPLAERDVAWDASASERRVRAWAGGESNINWDKYRRAFFWYDSDNPELFGSYKLGFADIVNGRLTAIPRGIFACAVVLKGGRGGVNIPSGDKEKIIAHINKYYAKMDMESPFKGEDMDELETKEGRVLSKASLDKIKAAVAALQALLESVEGEPAPEKSTPPSEAEKEAADMESILDGIDAELAHLDTKQAEARLNQLLEKINMEVKTNA